MNRSTAVPKVEPTVNRSVTGPMMFRNNVLPVQSNPNNTGTQTPTSQSAGTTASNSNNNNNATAAINPANMQLSTQMITTNTVPPLAQAQVTAQMGQDLATLFECPVCYDYALPPIIQCSSGHIVCSKCRQKLTSCPSCRGQLGNIRNLALERLAETVSFPCKFTGCSMTMRYQDKLEHEEQCDCKPYSCPCPGASCKWFGSLDDVMPHLTKDHKNITLLNGEDIVFLATDIHLPGSVDWVMLQTCFGSYFMLVLEKQDREFQATTFYAIVQLIGTKKQAANYKYKLELVGPNCRFLWEATTRSIHDGIAQAIQESDCLIFDAQIAERFAEANNLGINVAIALTTQ